MKDEQHRLALPQGTRIRDFEFHRVLGYGGFRITYLGWNMALDILVAIKEYLPADLATREQDLSVVPQSTPAESDFQWGPERFLDEARTLARFQHPNILRVHHFLWPVCRCLPRHHARPFRLGDGVRIVGCIGGCGSCAGGH